MATRFILFLILRNLPCLLVIYNDCNKHKRFFLLGFNINHCYFLVDIINKIGGILWKR